MAISEKMSEKLFVSWYMTAACNFNCDYCGSSKKSAIPRLDAQKLIQSLIETRKECIVSMTGGEPFLYPNFVDLCKDITKYHKIALGTNLSLSSRIKEFADSISPERVDFIYASVHIEEREKRNGVDDFINNVSLLKTRGMTVLANYVLHPALIEKFRRDYTYFESKGIKLLPKPFVGVYKGKGYPHGYSDDEKKLILREDPHAINTIPFCSKGINCNAGKTFARMQPDGTFTRCAADMTVLGNIYDGIRLDETAKPCKINTCPCFGYTLINKGYYGYDTLWGDKKEEIDILRALETDRIKEIFGKKSASDLVGSSLYNVFGCDILRIMKRYYFWPNRLSILIGNLLRKLIKS